MAVRLAQLPTLRELYTKGVLNVSKTQTASARFGTNTRLLDRVSLWQGDITKLEVDAIVNAANKFLLGGGGVDGAIHSKAGRELLEECRTLGGCDTGDSKITLGYRLPAKHVIHTVGPVYSPSDIETRAKQLSSCYRTSLEIAARDSLKSIAFCSVSTGIYGYPIEDATHIALQEVRTFLDTEQEEQKLERVIFVVWSDKDKSVYEELIPGYFPPDEVKNDEVSPAPES